MVERGVVMSDDIDLTGFPPNVREQGSVSNTFHGIQCQRLHRNTRVQP